MSALSLLSELLIMTKPTFISAIHCIVNYTLGSLTIFEIHGEERCFLTMITGPCFRTGCASMIVQEKSAEVSRDGCLNRMLSWKTMLEGMSLCVGFGFGLTVVVNKGHVCAGTRSVRISKQKASQMTCLSATSLTVSGLQTPSSSQLCLFAAHRRPPLGLQYDMPDRCNARCDIGFDGQLSERNLFPVPPFFVLILHILGRCRQALSGSQRAGTCIAGCA